MAVQLGNGKHLPLDLLVRKPPDHDIKHYLICVVNILVAPLAPHLEPACPGDRLQPGLKACDGLVTTLHHRVQLHTVHELVPLLDNHLPGLLHEVLLGQGRVKLLSHLVEDPAQHLPQTLPQTLLSIPINVGQGLYSCQLWAKLSQASSYTKLPLISSLGRETVQS